MGYKKNKKRKRNEQIYIGETYIYIWAN